MIFDNKPLVITLKNKEIPYTLKTSNKAKQLRLSIKAGGKLVVTIPKRINPKEATKFMLDKEDWIIKTIEKTKLLPPKRLKGEKAEYKQHKKKALEMATNKVEHFNKFYGFNYNTIRIKNNETRWGSCSINKNLNFHYKIVFLEENLANYLIVHELCHLKEMNHSKRFWDLVAKAIPDYKVLRKLMRNIA